MESYGLYELWSSGRALEAGERLFASIPVLDQPRWAGRVLALCSAQLPPIPAIERVLMLTRTPARWKEAHDAFSEVRDHVLSEEDRHASSRDELRLRILFVAEIAAKLTYNASGASDAFDADTGPWLAATARSVVDHVGSTVFETDVWRTFTEPGDTMQEFPDPDA